MVTCVPGHSVLHRLGEHVRGVVPDQLQRARVVAGDEFDLGVVVDRIGRGRRARRRAPWRRCAWPARARCPWRCRGRWCLGGYSRRAPSGKVSVTIRASLLLLTRCLRMQVSVRRRDIASGPAICNAGTRRAVRPFPACGRGGGRAKARPSMTRSEAAMTSAPAISRTRQRLGQHEEAEQDRRHRNK